MKHDASVNPHVHAAGDLSRDFGRIYVRVPRVSVEPTTIKELADTLKYYHERGEPVCVRNTAHSVNGQTLTDGVQIGLRRLREVRFDRARMELIAGGGTPWHEVFDALDYPAYTPPVFTTNPGQRIQIGGTISVGGGGPMASHAGGLWNWITGLTVVTMNGEVIDCSSEQEPDVFQYAVGGFGRIGVIARAAIQVKPGVPRMLHPVLTYDNRDRMIEDLARASDDNLFCGVMGIAHFTDNLLIHAAAGRHLLLAFMPDQGVSAKAMMRILRDRYHFRQALYWQRAPNATAVRVRYRSRWTPSREIIDYYPRRRISGQHKDICHAWSDYILPADRYPAFFDLAWRRIRSRGLHRFITQQATHSGWIHIRFPQTLAIRNRGRAMPLSLDIGRAPLALALSLLLDVPRARLPEARALIDELTEETLSCGGKRYMYGVHDLTPEQIEQQYGAETIREWQRIKHSLDPRGLLNRGVIEHLDDG